MVRASKRKLKKEYYPDVKAEKDTAQLLINLTGFSKTIEEAKKIIEESGAHIIETKYISPNLFLIILDVLDMRNIALKLMENGFSVIKGINAPFNKEK
jgi:hypothetical protein